MTSGSVGRRFWGRASDYGTGEVVFVDGGLSGG